ncbi:TldD/PmbA family protein [Candidatus Epulonipiscium viviparus]|uniref:TldD/PmbA family protein n=1 Tax=Candidatus Epulonipiscium viviparus TaxID=420336 RepID=UPI0027380E80|nr:TldD/PmbA family protein [Candidatus Epulopiscium viviparus]
MNISTIFEKAKEAGFSASEIYILESKQNSVSTCDGEIDEHQISTAKAISFRGLIDNKMGYAYSERMDDSIIDQLLQTAKECATLVEKDEREFIYAGASDYIEVEQFDTAIADLSPKEITDMALLLEKKLVNKVEKVESANIATQISKIHLANSRGLDLSFKNTQIVAYIFPILKDGDSGVVDSYAISANTSIASLDLDKVADTALKNVSRKVNAATIPSGSYKVILENKAFIGLLKAMKSAFFADVMQKGKSKLAGLEGTAIASLCVNLVDDPYMENSSASRGFDDEGFKTYKKYLIENGIFTGFLHNLSTAHKSGTLSTGNASKASVTSPIKVDASNLYIEPGTLSADELIAIAANGVYITDLDGLHSGANSITGDFSLSARGLMIENGKLTSAVKQIVVSGNFFDLLQDVEAVANDFEITFANVGSPSILIRKLSIAGK